MTERSCSVCHQERVLLFIAVESGVVISGQVVEDPHEGHRVRAGDLVCISHAAVRPDGRYVRLEDGG